MAIIAVRVVLETSYMHHSLISGSITVREIFVNIRHYEDIMTDRSLEERDVLLMQLFAHDIS